MAQTQIVIGSDFEEDADGWTAVGDVQLFQYQAGGGNPSGNIFVDDLRTPNSDLRLRFVAPGQFLGDMSQFYGGTLTYDINPTEDSFRDWDIMLVGAGLSITYGLGVPVEDQWNRKTIPLDENNGLTWFIDDTLTNPTEEQFRAILADLQQILINAEFRFDLSFNGTGDEQTRLDNVIMTSPLVETFDWRRLNSAQQSEGQFDTFGQAMAGATPGDILVFVNTAGTPLDLGNVTITIDDLTVAGDMLDATFKLGAGVRDFALDGFTNADVTGNAIPNHIIGSVGDNVINGGARGGDLLEGGGGNDRYYVDHSTDRVIEGGAEGVDTVYTKTSFALEALSEIEFLRPWGTTPVLELTGNEFAQTIYGSAHGDTIDGGGGVDILRGLGGDDTYIVKNAGVRIIEAADQGEDIVRSEVNFTLPNNVEDLELVDFAIKGIGNNLDNVIDGNDADNILQGRGGNDVLIGYGGQDRMTGGVGADTFVLDGPDIGNDVVLDFSHLGGDRLAVFGSEFGLPAGPLDSDYFVTGDLAFQDDHGRFIWYEDEAKLFWDADGIEASPGASESDVLIARINASSGVHSWDFIVL